MRTVYTRRRLAGPVGASGSQEGASAASARPLDAYPRRRESRSDFGDLQLYQLILSCSDLGRAVPIIIFS